MRGLLVSVTALLIAGCGPDKPVDDLVFEKSEIVTVAPYSLSLEIGSKTYSGVRLWFYRYAGSLDDLAEESTHPPRRSTPIVFSDEEPNFRPSVGKQHENIPGTTKVRLKFFCDPYQVVPRIALEPETIYFYDTTLRGVVKIGAFEVSDDQEAVEEKAKAAIRSHIENAGGK